MEVDRAAQRLERLPRGVLRCLRLHQGEGRVRLQAAAAVRGLRWRSWRSGKLRQMKRQLVCGLRCRGKGISRRRLQRGSERGRLRLPSALLLLSGNGKRLQQQLLRLRLRQPTLYCTVQLHQHRLRPS